VKKIMMMIEVGDYVICKSGGVWSIAGISNGKIHLVGHESGAMKVLPVINEEIVRKIVPKETILEVIDRVGFIRTIQASNDKTRKELYDKAMAKYDEIEWIKVIKTVYLRQKAKRLMSSELAYSEKARGYLHGEISVLLEIPLDEVEDYIFYAISKNNAGNLSETMELPLHGKKPNKNGA
jgi:CarD family transcriptional regulator